MILKPDLALFTTPLTSCVSLSLHLPFGFELAELSLDPEVEASLDAQAKAALGAARLLGPLIPGVGSGMPPSSWLPFG